MKSMMFVSRSHKRRAEEMCPIASRVSRDRCKWNPMADSNSTKRDKSCNNLLLATNSIKLQRANYQTRLLRQRASGCQDGAKRGSRKLEVARKRKWHRQHEEVERKRCSSREQPKCGCHQYERQQKGLQLCHRRNHQIGPQMMALVCIYTVIIILAVSAPAVEGVDCFKCSSRNGSNPACEDPFHNLNTTRITFPVLPDPPPNVIYHTPCYAGKKGKEGLFPASACIKLTGTFDATGETLVVRHCALDSGTLTQDTELARMSHCGKFQFEGDLLRGCVLACPEDACNSAPPSVLETKLVLLKMASMLVALMCLSVFIAPKAAAGIIHIRPGNCQIKA